MNNSSSFNDSQSTQELNIREQLEKYLRHGWWFVLGVIVCVTLAFLYLRYTVSSYQTQASVIIKDEKKGGGISELAAFESMGLLGGFGSASIENEIEILKSKRLLTSVVEQLNLQVTYLVEGRIIATEKYNDIPFSIRVLGYAEDFVAGTSVQATMDKNSKVTLVYKGKKSLHQLGETVTLPFGSFIIMPNESVDSKALELIGTPVIVEFSTVEDKVAQYQEAIQINLTNKNSSVIQLSLNHPVKNKAEDVLNELVTQYNRDAIEDKNLVSENTAKFIDERLRIISGELDSVEQGKVTFKTQNKLTDLMTESKLYLENASEFNKKQLEVGTQLALTNSMLEHISRDSRPGLLPVNLGFEDVALTQLTAEYNKLVIERNHLLKSATDKNPAVIAVDDQLAQLKTTIVSSLQNTRSSLNVALKDFNRQENLIEGRIAKAPGQEMEFRGIERQQTIKEALYLYLLQKREENSISLAVTAPKAKIVDYAYSSKHPISPKRKIVYLASLLLGLLIPFGLIYTKDLLDNKVNNRKDVERIVPNIPLVGELPRIGKSESEVIVSNDCTVLAEAFRILRTNIQYLFVNIETKGLGKSIFVTSSVKGEGKTFTSFNLALTLASTNNKVAIVGIDLRNPQLQRYLPDTNTQRGVSNFLFDSKLTVKDITQISDMNANLAIITSGSIPPNPAELLMSKRIEVLVEELRQSYDYVIYDTAPLLLVTDTFLISKYADATIYVMRAGYTEQQLLEFIKDNSSQGKINNVALVLNDVSMANFGYGNKYGYTYGGEKETFIQRIKKAFTGRA